MDELEVKELLTMFSSGWHEAEQQVYPDIVEWRNRGDKLYGFYREKDHTLQIACHRFLSKLLKRAEESGR